MNKVINVIKKVLYYSIPILLLIWCSQMIFNNSIWLDEAFSLSMVKQGFIDIIKNTAIDVHPPLYYIILKIIVTIFGILGDENIIFVSKFVSILPVAILIFVSYKEISKLFGKKTAFLFNILILGMPKIMQYAIEIRMYSLSILFVTLFYISTIKWKKDSNNKELYKMVLFAILSAYTHYFAIVAVACIYGVLITEAIIKKDYDKLKKIMLSIFVIGLLYLPWVIILIKQVLTVKESYWIGNITKNTIKSFFQYPYTIEGNGILTNMIAIILLVSIIPIKNTNNKYAIYGFLVPIGTIIIGVIVSKLIRPIFISRYMVCGLGCLWFAVAIKLSRMFKREYFYTFIVGICTVVAIWSNYGIMKKEKLYKNEQLKLTNYIDNISKENSKIIFDSNQLQRIISYYYPNIETYCYKQSITNLTKQVYTQTNMKVLENIIDVENMKNKGNKIYFCVMKDNIVKELKENNYTYEECGNYKIEMYEFRILTVE